MKKFISLGMALLLAIILTLTTTGCGGGTSPSNPEKTPVVITYNVYQIDNDGKAGNAIPMDESGYRFLVDNQKYVVVAHSDQQADSQIYVTLGNRVNTDYPNQTVANLSGSTFWCVGQGCNTIWVTVYDKTTKTKINDFGFPVYVGERVENTSNYQISVYAPNNDNDQSLYQDYDGTAWNAYTGRLYFTLLVAGVRGGAPSADFQLWKSDEPQNYSNPQADLAGFKKICDLVGQGKEDSSYQFFEAGRYLIKAYELNSKNELTHTRLNIMVRPIAPPVVVAEPDFSVFLTVAPGEVQGEKEVTVILKNNGGDISNVIVNLTNSWNAENSLIARAGLTGAQDFSADSGDKSIGYGMIPKLGSVVLTRNDTNYPVGNSFFAGGYIIGGIGDVMAGETLVFDCIYQIDQDAPGKGVVRKVK